MTPFVFFFTLCTISHTAPYLHDCQPLMINHSTKEKCELYKKKFMAKAPVWSDNPAHPFFKKVTAAPITEPMCFPNPHMNHIVEHIGGRKYGDGRVMEPPFENTWEGKDYRPPAKYEKFLSSIE